MDIKRFALAGAGAAACLTLFTAPLAAAAAPAAAPRLLPMDCVSYGVDFQNGGAYFQSPGSSDPFTFVSEFASCGAADVDLGGAHLHIGG
ncbi:hypothetical protein ABT160_07755 [Streptomyces sp. NPDC001941]|uniref:hypothetical protein n=1 Tax=Streptomyces sp. NPDC001941 TaxID=3154659 RepID=UPI003316EB0F